MAFDASKRDLTVAVIGTGTMGRGIVQVSAAGGMHVIAYDEKAGGAQAAKDFTARMLERNVEKGQMSPEDAKASVDRITVATSLAVVARADVVVEAVFERLDVKQDLFEKLDAACPPTTILASNTSSLPVTAIAARTRHPERCAGMHFFNPVPLMRLVEVIPGLKTATWVSEALMTIGRRMTREPVLCVDSPGFLVNHIGRGLGPETQRILQEGIASIDEIDRILTGAPGFRMGPFTLGDMVGIDVGNAAMASMYEQFFHEPAYAPSPLMALRAAGGLYGQKSGSGWYTYKDGKKVEPPLKASPTVKPGDVHVWVRPSDHNQDLQEPFLAYLKAQGFNVETGTTPSVKALIVITPIGYDVTTAVAELKLDGARTVAVDVLFGLKGPRTVMVTPATAPEYRDRALAMMSADGQQAIAINDSPGFVAQRAVAALINVGCNVAQRGVGVPADIDKGAKLGLGYPYGPIEWGDRIGPGRVLFIMQRLHTFYQEPRYRPSAWLKRRVMLGLPLSAPEGTAR
ncbi:MAG: 3-hydroxyacyl-CoA dehydrogenase [Hyphomicrobiaceae bacterium]|nr:3-hydroxyacyl-CoA dehydrogenase [Hyphomicrobiaceae bacterium]